jgi:Tfp pilus assembly protein PilP
MKMAIKLTFKVTTGILLTALMAGAAWAQTPGAPQAAKPQPGAPAPAVKPAVIPASKPAAKPAAHETDTDADSTSELKSVKVTHSSGDIQIELTASGAVTPRVSKLSSPSRVLVELPETTEATPQNHIAVGSAGVKGVRIGMNGKTPPTTSVVVDLDKDIAYELTPGPAGKFVLTLHTGDKNGVAKSSPAPEPVKAAPVKTQAAAPVVQAQAKTQPVVTKPQAAAPVVVAAKTTPAPQAATLKTVAAVGKTTSIVAPAAAAKTAPVVTPSVSSAQAKPENTVKPAPSVEALKGSELPKPEDKKWAMTGKRDPFFSPVVQGSSGSGCSTGKKCLEIGQINLRGVVKSENGFIAVVTNTLNKAYFLRENDPVFNGYVVKITGDSVVFQETVQDKLGKTFTREVVKKIFTPAV